MDNIVDSNSYRHDITWYLTLLYYVIIGTASILFGESKTGSYLLIGSIFLLLAIYLIKTHMIIYLPGSTKGFSFWMLLFSAFCLVSSYWAENSQESIRIGFDLLEITFATIILLFNYQNDDNSVNKLLEIVMYGSYIILFIVIINYGISGLISLFLAGSRLDVVGGNANQIGSQAFYSIIIHLYFLSQGEKRKTGGLLIIATLVLVVSQSRKMYLGFVLSVLLYYYFGSLARNDRQNNRLKFIGIILIGILGLFVISQIPAFSVIFERVSKMLETLTGKASTDSSTSVRMELTGIGMRLFHSSPWLGVGIGNPGLYAGSIFGRDSYYLHNNYVELLAGGGVVGTILFYSVYVVILYRYLKYRNFDDKQFNLCLTLLLIRLFFDYGAVSYSEKAVYVYMMILWLKSTNLKLRATGG